MYYIVLYCGFTKIRISFISSSCYLILFPPSHCPDRLNARRPEIQNSTAAQDCPSSWGKWCLGSWGRSEQKTYVIRGQGWNHNWTKPGCIRGVWWCLIDCTSYLSMKRITICMANLRIKHDWIRCLNPELVKWTASENQAKHGKTIGSKYQWQPCQVYSIPWYSSPHFVIHEIHDFDAPALNLSHEATLACVLERTNTWARSNRFHRNLSSWILLYNTIYRSRGINL